MTDFATQYVLGAPIGSMVGKDKGDLSNRCKCAGAQVLNNVQTLAEDTVVIGGAALTAKAASKSPKLMQKMAGFVDFVLKKFPKFKKPVDLVGESGKVFSTFEISRGKYIDKLLKGSAKQKAAACVVLPAIALLSYITGKQIYKMGQIDQKYTDKAKIEKAQNKDLGI